MPWLARLAGGTVIVAAGIVIFAVLAEVLLLATLLFVPLMALLDDDALGLRVLLHDCTALITEGSRFIRGEEDAP